MDNKYKIILDDWTAETLLLLVKEHKEKCQGSYCNISSYLMGNLYVRIKGRPLNEEEHKVFG